MKMIPKSYLYMSLISISLSFLSQSTPLTFDTTAYQTTSSSLTPVSILISSSIQEQPFTNHYNTTANDLDGPCKDILLVNARATTEPGNIGYSTGQKLCNYLKSKYGQRFGCQGVGKEYKATVKENLYPKGTSEEAIKVGKDIFIKARSKCPKMIILFQGYSQGASLMHSAISEIDADLRNSITAGVLFGDPKNLQTNGQIRGFPKEKLSSYCRKEDLLCFGQLTVTNPHLHYIDNGDTEKARDFLISKIDQELKSKQMRS